MNDSLLLNAKMVQALPAIVSALERYGFRAVQSFDLRSALAAHSECACPHRGTEQCTCQYTILLIYQTGQRTQTSPIILTLHAHNDQTQVALIEPAFVPVISADGEVTPFEQVVIALIMTAYGLASPHPAAVTTHVSG